MTIFLLAADRAGAAQAAEAAPHVLVPASAEPLHVAVELPEGASRLVLAAELTEKLHAAEVPPTTAAVGAWQLVELDGQGVVVAAQSSAAIGDDGRPNERARRLLAVIPPAKPADGADGADGAAAPPRRFRLQRTEANDAPKTPFAWKELDDRSVELSENDRPAFRYNFGAITDPSVPETDPRRTRACYIHPVWGLHGEVLTEDFPKDHYHHHGVFWTWPHVGIEGKKYDLWADAGIRQQFVAWLGREAGPAAAVLGVENGWFVGDRKVMIERVWMRAFRASDEGRVLDLELTFIPVERPVTLQGAEGKSYGGLTVRFRGLPRKDVTITVPTGVAADDLYETPLAWVDYTAKYPDAPGPSGAAIMVPPSHPDFPPTWLTRHYGPQCIGWPGVEPQTFPPGEPIRLSYRLWIHKDAAPLEKLAEVYNAFKQSLDVRWGE